MWGHTGDVAGSRTRGGGERDANVALGRDVRRDAGSLGGMQGHGRRYMEQNLGVQGMWYVMGGCCEVGGHRDVAQKGM